MLTIQDTRRTNYDIRVFYLITLYTSNFLQHELTGKSLRIGNIFKQMNDFICGILENHTSEQFCLNSMLTAQVKCEYSAGCIDLHNIPGIAADIQATFQYAIYRV